MIRRDHCSIDLESTPYRPENLILTQYSFHEEYILSYRESRSDTGKNAFLKQK